MSLVEFEVVTKENDLEYGIKFCLYHSLKSLMSVEDNKTAEYIFPAEGSDTSKPHNGLSDYQFKAYDPVEFKKIRDVYDITPEYVKESFENLQRAKNSEEKIYCISKDSKLLLKSITKMESFVVRKKIHNYGKYFAIHKDTLMEVLYGMFRIKTETEDFYFVLTTNKFPVDRELDIIFDLKGNSGRKADPKKKNILKEHEFQRMKKEWDIDHKEWSKLLDQLKRDVDFLDRRDALEYSLLIGVIKPEEGEENPEKIEGAIQGKRGYQYFVSIIDYLQTFMFTKVVGYIPPKAHKRYAKAFLKYMEKELQPKDKEDSEEENPKKAAPPAAAAAAAAAPAAAAAAEEPKKEQAGFEDSDVTPSSSDKADTDDDDDETDSD